MQHALGSTQGPHALSIHAEVANGVQLQAGKRPVPSCRHASHTRHQRVVAASAPGNPPPSPEPESQEELAKRFFSSPAPARRSVSQSNPGQTSALDMANPINLGKKARRAFDEVWTQLATISSPTKSIMFDDTLQPTTDADFEAPQAAYTTVLVVGATGRVGRVLIRKLLLRGYKVKALVRRRDAAIASKQQAKDEYMGPALPAAVEVVYGDLGDMDACQEAVRGVDKVIFCATARSQITGDLLRVDERGVTNIAKALQDEFTRAAHREKLQQLAGDDSPEARRARRRLFSPKSKKEIADFSQPYHQQRWDITFVGTPEERQAAAAAAAAAASGATQVLDSGLQRPAVDRWMAASNALAEITNEDHLIFEGTLFQRGTYAEVGAQLHPRLPGGEHRTADTEAVLLKVRGDGNQYACVLQTTNGAAYIARFPTRQGFLNVRLPYNIFRPEQNGQPPLDPAKINYMGIRYECRRQTAAARSTVQRVSKGRPTPTQQDSSSDGKFSLEVDYIKALPGGDEPDVVLVSMSRNALANVMGDLERNNVVAAKRRGEEHLRASGLGYTIIRPGLLVDEPGGYKALVFDQGDRIDQPISAADVADICLRSLHEPSARNKTFDVCFELSTPATSMYELVTSVPDKSSNYLSQAAAALTKNT